MTLNDLLPTVHALPRTDKLRLIQVLAADIASEEGLIANDLNAAYPVWSPHEAFEGAATLLRVLEQEQAAQ